MLLAVVVVVVVAVQVLATQGVSRVGLAADDGLQPPPLLVLVLLLRVPKEHCADDLPMPLFGVELLLREPSAPHAGLQLVVLQLLSGLGAAECVGVDAV